MHCPGSASWRPKSCGGQKRPPLAIQPGPSLSLPVSLVGFPTRHEASESSRWAAENKPVGWLAAAPLTQGHAAPLRSWASAVSEGWRSSRRDGVPEGFQGLRAPPAPPPAPCWGHRPLCRHPDPCASGGRQGPCRQPLLCCDKLGGPGGLRTRRVAHGRLSGGPARLHSLAAGTGGLGRWPSSTASRQPRRPEAQAGLSQSVRPHHRDRAPRGWADSSRHRSPNLLSSVRCLPGAGRIFPLKTPFFITKSSTAHSRVGRPSWGGRLPGRPLGTRSQTQSCRGRETVRPWGPGAAVL